MSAVRDNWALCPPLSWARVASLEPGGPEKRHFQLGSIGLLPLDFRRQLCLGVIRDRGNNWLCAGDACKSTEREKLMHNRLRWNTRGQ